MEAIIRTKPSNGGAGSNAAILAIGAYVPSGRISRSTIAEMWGAPAIPGERAMAGTDEDAVTLGVEAALSCLANRDQSRIDAVYFASTTAPYAERQGAAILAAALDLRDAIATADFGDTLRAGTAALRAARDAVIAGTVREVLVVASDRRLAEPESPYEQIFGDGAAAVLVGRESPDALARIDTMVSVAEDVTSGWRRSEDRYVQSFSPKHEMDFGFTRPLVRALNLAIQESGLDPAGTRLAVPSPDGRAHFKVGKDIGLTPDRVQDPLVLSIGALGVAAPFVSLVGALEESARGETVLLGAAGEGADAAVLPVLRPLPSEAWRTSRVSEGRREVPSYGEFVRANRLMDVARPAIPTSPVTGWRDRRQNLNLHGTRCRSCGLVQYPMARVCQRCRHVDHGEEVPLSHRGRVFSYTLDHVVAASYSAIPVARVIVDLEGGGRYVTQMTDCDPKEVRVEMPVDLTLRRMNEGGNLKNYFWKVRPARNRGEEAGREEARS